MPRLPRRLRKKKIALIEANTNASGYLIGNIAYALHDLSFDEWSDKLAQMFSENLNWDRSKLFITDSEPLKQKMYLEFLLYQEFCKQHGKQLEIIDIEKLNLNIGSLQKEFRNISIYNRSTDFYLKNYKQLLKCFLDQSVKLSPNPIGYDLFAHKDNLNQWSVAVAKKEARLRLKISSDEAQNFQSMLLLSRPINQLFEDFDQAWHERKKFFFKPSDSYGGKATYRGSSISKKYFRSAWDENFLAQSYFPPAKFKDRDNLDWKFDLRVFVYKDEVLPSLARVYQGQITNFNVNGGGFAPVTYY